ncbi:MULTISPECIES: DUF5074 domain-containing protein [Flavobacterium]|uniref:YncE family protein n=1 Tax=Flavobacterium TaxID=237 RepID=UPI00086A558F|nr:MULTISPECIES: DUF5074 domain-containing protein [Flavobacterium]MBN9286004.1 hypothetical protein [Flavobacterium sp.]ODS77527.1 MAG: hypothetical protein ABS44_22520 [Chryseobacterium sp. SCN 40-13]OJV69061.1 MAG: hypothetical protein BGO42_05000 [Flavobacterium sp. 40-81]
MKINKLLGLSLLSAVFFASCTDEEIIYKENPAPVSKGAYENGILVMNEGNFGQPNAEVSFISAQYPTLFQNNIFNVVNPTKVLGNTGQSIGFNGDNAYIVLNGDNKIEVVNRYTFVSVATIQTGLQNPRYISFANGKGYVTNWGDAGVATDDYVAVLNLTTNQITGNIAVVEGPEQIITYNNNLYVAHKGGYGFNDKISVINSTSNTVQTTITVGDVPSVIEVSQDNLYVLCSGKPSWAGAETGGKLVKVNLANNTVAQTLDFGATEHPGFMDIENGTIYYMKGKGVYQKDVATATLPTTPTFTSTATTVYGFAAHNNKIYVGDALNYVDNGKVFVTTMTGAALNTYTVGVMPNGFYFNN